MDRLFSPTLHIRLAMLAALAMLATGCASSRKAAEGTKQPTETASPAQLDAQAALARVYQARIDEKNLTADLGITITYGDDEISAPGSLHMRRGEMIRLQVFVPLLGTEVGRVELTPDGVTIIDRLHKQYMQASYSEVDFLSKNGLTFYSLQSLFWNQVFVPGQNEAGIEALQAFDTAFDNTSATLNMSLNRGKLAYNWTAQTADGHITAADISYGGTAATARLTWDYAKFKALGSKQFPTNQTISIEAATASKRKKATLTLKLSSIGTDSGWSSTTEISKKYKKVSPSEALKKLFGI